jgi:subtilisin family serine protease
MEAADYIFQKAARLGRPAVINISLGAHGGPHDGSTPAERWLDQLLQTPNRAIVVSAGNSWRQRAHAMGVARRDAPAILPWIMQPHDPTSNEVEIWYSGPHSLEVVLRSPDGSSIVTVPRGHSQSLFNAASEEVISIIHNEFNAQNGDHQISILLDKSLAPTGAASVQWQIELQVVGSEDAPFHAWVERDDAERETLSFFHPSVVSTSHTLGSISCGKDTIVVGSYRAGDPDRGISSFSSAGPTRDGRQKPEVSAPGQHVAAPQDQVGVLAAESGTNGAARKSGTSMAAPHVTGLIALLLQAAQEPLSVEQIRARLFAAVRADPPAPATWHPQYGFGRVDAGALFQ